MPIGGVGGVGGVNGPGGITSSSLGDDYDAELRDIWRQIDDLRKNYPDISLNDVRRLREELKQSTKALKDRSLLSNGQEKALNLAIACLSSVSRYDSGRNLNLCTALVSATLDARKLGLNDDQLEGLRMTRNMQYLSESIMSEHVNRDERWSLCNELTNEYWALGDLIKYSPGSFTPEEREVIKNFSDFCNEHLYNVVPPPPTETLANELNQRLRDVEKTFFKP